MGFKKESRSDGEWTQLTFQVHPDDTPHALFLLPLKTHVMLAISGTEQPAEQEKPKGGERAKRAGILCNDSAFQRWLYEHARAQGMVFPVDTKPIADNAAYLLRELCQVQSRAEIDHDEAARAEFDSIVDEFYRTQHGESDEALAAQRDRT